MSRLYSIYKYCSIRMNAWIYKSERKICDTKFKKLGVNVRYSPLESYIVYNDVEIGDNVFINRGAHLSGKICIGSNTLIGPYVYITNGDHNYSTVGKMIREQERSDQGRVIIGEDCWIGANTMITKAVTIGEGTIVGGSSVVTKDLPMYTLCAGNPCRPIKKRYTDEELLEHLIMIGKTPDEAKAVVEKRNVMLKAITEKVK